MEGSMQIEAPAREESPRAVEGAREDVLALARLLAERLARVSLADRGGDDVRLARALALNVVDLLEQS